MGPCVRVIDRIPAPAENDRATSARFRESLLAFAATPGASTTSARLPCDPGRCVNSEGSARRHLGQRVGSSPLHDARCSCLVGEGRSRTAAARAFATTLAGMVPWHHPQPHAQETLGSRSGEGRVTDPLQRP